MASADEEHMSLTNDCLSAVDNRMEDENSQADDDGDARPVSFPSRGKWMPGTKPFDIHKSGCSVEYDCKPCNRRLTGRVVYEKHLQSRLHFKRVAHTLSSSTSSEVESFCNDSFRSSWSPTCVFHAIIDLICIFFIIVLFIFIYLLVIIINLCVQCSFTSVLLRFNC